LCAEDSARYNATHLPERGVNEADVRLPSQPVIDGTVGVAYIPA